MLSVDRIDCRHIPRDVWLAVVTSGYVTPRGDCRDVGEGDGWSTVGTSSQHCRRPFILPTHSQRDQRRPAQVRRLITGFVVALCAQLLPLFLFLCFMLLVCELNWLATFGYSQGRIQKLSLRMTRVWTLFRSWQSVLFAVLHMNVLNVWKSQSACCTYRHQWRGMLHHIMAYINWGTCSPPFQREAQGCMKGHTGKH